MQDHESIWSQSTELPHRKPLHGDIRVDAVVIGAGMAGVLIADRLQRCGVKTVVLEASRTGSGQTRNTTAKITSQHDMVYDALIKRFGEAGARQYARANEQAIGEYAAMVKERGIDCDFHETSAYLYSQTSAEPLRREAEAAAGLGIDAHFVADAGLPFPIKGAVRFDG